MSPKKIHTQTFTFLVFLGIVFVSISSVTHQADVAAKTLPSSVSLFHGRHDPILLLSVISARQETLLSSRNESRDLRSSLAVGGPDSDEVITDWRSQTLSEEALKAVMQESLESAQKANELRSNLQAIHEQLKERKLNDLQKRLNALQDDERSILRQQDVLLEKKQQMNAAELSFERATTELSVKRNTETRFYKRVMEREQERITLSESVRLGTKKSEDGLTDLPLSDEEKSLFSDRLVALDEKLLLMKDGIPEETAEMYLSAQKKWHDLSVNRDDMLTSLARADATLLEVRSGISTLTDQIMKAKEKVFSLALSDAFVWPVHGSITAGFFDREYQRVFGVPHRAIDIATHQSTPVHSIADGVVYATRDGGETGYSYVLIGHSDGYSSLYGHVSQFLVHAGDTVSAGQVIALSGGAPGTHGAGHMTTGAHLHLEVMKNGVHLDPRTVLPSVR